MKYTVVSSKRLGTICWLPDRFLGGCGKCRRLAKCKTREAQIARKKKS